MRKIIIFVIVCFSFILCGCNNKSLVTADLDTLINIVAVGNPQDLENMVNNIGDVNKFVEQNTPKGSYKVYLLHIASKNTKYPETINILAKKNIDINYYDEDIDAPLNIAVKFNQNTGIVTTLVENGAKPWKNDYSVILLSAVNDNPNPEILKEVLNIKEVKELAKQKYVQCPVLYYASQAKDNPEEKIKILTDNGFDVRAGWNGTGKNPLEMLKEQYNSTGEKSYADAIKVLEKYYK